MHNKLRKNSFIRREWKLEGEEIGMIYLIFHSASFQIV